MPNKKLKKSKIQFLKPYLLPITLIMSAIIIAGAIVYVNARQDRKTEQALNSSNNVKISLDNPAVAQAKAAADKYFEALNNCDLETANELRFVPKDDIDASNKDQCKKDCAGPITYKFVEVTSYQNKVVDGQQVEIAGFGYLFTCGNMTRSTGVIMTRDIEKNKWLLFSTI
jgi:hypothetical protein